MTELYAVVKSNPRCDFHFTKFHGQMFEAKEEAERLCVKEGCDFLVLKVIAKCGLAEVRWEK